MAIKFSSLLLTGLTILGLASQAGADSLDRAGSLLLFPQYDNSRIGIFSVTVTNTNSDDTIVSGSGATALAAGTVDVEFVYIDGPTCTEFNRTRRLTPNDTITVLTRNDNPNSTKGYVYCFAKSPTTGQAIKFDWLIGDSKAISFDAFGVDFPPVVFKAGSALLPGAITDIDGDHRRDLNGTEYEKVSDELLVPRFVADFDGVSQPELVLVALSGGASFTTVINFLVFNNNEEPFSAQYAFSCWSRVRLKDISGVFTQSFLASTNHNPSEGITIPFTVPPPQMLLPLPPLELGWFRMDGSVAYSSASSIQDPAFMAVRVERFAIIAAMSSLPYGIGEQGNGDLVVQGPFADTN